jgi:hypothetical protein
VRRRRSRYGARVFDEMPKRKERGKVTIIQMQGHPIQT